MATKKIRYVGPFDVVEIAETGQSVEQNHQVDVEEDVAKRLLEQAVWEPATKKGGSS